jgi:hypothetical protein
MGLTVILILILSGCNPTLEEEPNYGQNELEQDVPAVQEPNGSKQEKTPGISSQFKEESAPGGCPKMDLTKETEEQPEFADVISKYRRKIMKMPGVKGVAVGSCPNNPQAYCVLVYSITGKWPPGLPPQLDGYPVAIVKIKKGFRPM